MARMNLKSTKIDGSLEVVGDITLKINDRGVQSIHPETGEITYATERRIVSYEGNFLYFNNAILAETYGKRFNACLSAYEVKGGTEPKSGVVTTPANAETYEFVTDITCVDVREYEYVCVACNR